MKIECFNYWPMRPLVDISEVKRAMPTELREALMKGTLHTDFGIYIESSQTETIEQIDAYFKIGKRNRFLKQTYLEIGKREIPEYTHFSIRPKDLELNKDVFLDLSKPQCRSERCPWGVEIEGPVRVNAKRLQRVAFGEFQRGLRFGIELVVSAEMKRLFDSEGITGLEYERCLIQSDRGAPPADFEPPYCARVVHGSTQFGRDMIYNNYSYCRKHSTVDGAKVFDLRTPVEALGPYDFQMLNSITIGKRQYLRAIPLWIVSRRLLELLFKHKIRGLRTLSIFGKHKFLPVITV